VGDKSFWASSCCVVKSPPAAVVVVWAWVPVVATSGPPAGSPLHKYGRKKGAIESRFRCAIKISVVVFSTAGIAPILLVIGGYFSFSLRKFLSPNRVTAKAFTRPYQEWESS
jgi:hypothetical protein